MQERLTIARPYALAAFEVAQQRGELGAWGQALEFLAAVIADPEMQRVIRDPRVAASQLTTLIIELGGTRFNPEARNFVQTLINAERIDLAPEIAQLFSLHRAEVEGSLTIDVSSAYPLTAKEQQEIAQAVQARVGRTIALKCTTDRTLIGGAVIRAGDTVIDLSLRGRLQSLAASLA